MSSELIEARHLASGMIDGSIGVIEGCRRLIPILTDLGMNADTSEAVRILVGLDSQTDHIPLGDSRKHYNPAYLKELDREFDEFTLYFREEVIGACEEILQELSAKSN